MNFKSSPFFPHGAAFRLLCCSLLCFVFSGCAAPSAGTGEGKPQTGLEKRELHIIRTGAAQAELTLEAEIAKTPEQRNTGLMYRKELSNGKGMLFVFENDAVQSFWMKNTLIPLSIAFIMFDGTIVDIRDMYPGDTSSVHSSRSVRYALEVPQGWFEREWVKTGDTLVLSGL